MSMKHVALTWLLILISPVSLLSQDNTSTAQDNTSTETLSLRTEYGEMAIDYPADWNVQLALSSSTFPASWQYDAPHPVVIASLDATPLSEAEQYAAPLTEGELFATFTVIPADDYLTPSDVTLEMARAFTEPEFSMETFTLNNQPAAQITSEVTDLVYFAVQVNDAFYLALWGKGDIATLRTMVETFRSGANYTVPARAMPLAETLTVSGTRDVTFNYPADWVLGPQIGGSSLATDEWMLNIAGRFALPGDHQAKVWVIPNFDGEDPAVVAANHAASETDLRRFASGEFMFHDVETFILNGHPAARIRAEAYRMDAMIYAVKYRDDLTLALIAVSGSNNRWAETYEAMLASVPIVGSVSVTPVPTPDGSTVQPNLPNTYVHTVSSVQVTAAYPAGWFVISDADIPNQFALASYEGVDLAESLSLEDDQTMVTFAVLPAVSVYPFGNVVGYLEGIAEVGIRNTSLILGDVEPVTITGHPGARVPAEGPEGTGEIYAVRYGATYYMLVFAMAGGDYDAATIEAMVGSIIMTTRPEEESPTVDLPETLTITLEDEYAFTVRYPSDWTAQRQNAGASDADFVLATGIEIPASDALHSFEFETLSESQALMEIGLVPADMVMLTGGSPVGLIRSLDAYEEGTVYDVEALVIGGKPAARATTVNEAGVEGDVYVVAIMPQTYSFAYTISGDPHTTDATFLSILETLSLTPLAVDQYETETYVIAEAGISFTLDYPEGLIVTQGSGEGGLPALRLHLPDSGEYDTFFTMGPLTSAYVFFAEDANATPADVVAGFWAGMADEPEYGLTAGSIQSTDVNGQPGAVQSIRYSIVDMTIYAVEYPGDRFVIFIARTQGGRFFTATYRAMLDSITLEW